MSLLRNLVFFEKFYGTIRTIKTNIIIILKKRTRRDRSQRFQTWGWYYHRE